MAALILSATGYADGWRGWFTCDARFEGFAAAVAEGGDGIGLTEAIIFERGAGAGSGVCVAVRWVTCCGCGR